MPKIGFITASNGNPGVSTRSYFVQVPMELLEADISPSALKLYLVLLKYARQDSYCFPSHQTLAEGMGLKSRRVASLLKELVEAGLISVINRGKEGKSNLYKLQLMVGKTKLLLKEERAERAYPEAKDCYPSRQEVAEGGKQFIADDSHEVKLHEINNHTQTEEVESEPTKGRERNGHEQARSEVCVPVEKEEERPALATSTATGPSHIRKLESQVEGLLTGQGVAKKRAGQLAKTVVGAGLNGKYIEELVDWIKDQAAVRTIYNPAGLLVQMVYQLTPVPLKVPAGSTPVDRGNSFSSPSPETKMDPARALHHLPKLMEIEQRNLKEARSEKDKLEAQARLAQLLQLQAQNQQPKGEIRNQVTNLQQVNTNARKGETDYACTSFA